MKTLAWVALIAVLDVAALVGLFVLLIRGAT
jgi:hypothetical protein